MEVGLVTGFFTIWTLKSLDRYSKADSRAREHVCTRGCKAQLLPK